MVILPVRGGVQASCLQYCHTQRVLCNMLWSYYLYEEVFRHLVCNTVIHKGFCVTCCGHITCTRCSGILSAILPYTKGSVKHVVVLLPVRGGVQASCLQYCHIQRVLCNILWSYYLYEKVFRHLVCNTAIHKGFFVTCCGHITCTRRCSGILSAILPYTKGYV